MGRLTGMGDEAFDILIIGAGLSGVGAAWYVSRRLPRLRYAVLEARSSIGGTWDLFRYPGVRSDSDMHTLGFSFRPWTDDKAFADGETIRRYIEDTARESGVDQHIRLGQRVVAADWSSAEGRWRLTLESDAGEQRLTCRFLYLCTGYYDYAGGHQPSWPNMDAYRGRQVHPQAWPQDLDVSGKQVVVIGSGATAVTLVPALADAAAHVTMLQRSPTYVVARPARDAGAAWLRRRLPPRLAHALTRLKYVALGMAVYGYARRWPGKVKARLAALAREALGPEVELRHFTPAYEPWDQRLCVAPDGDLFAAIRSGKASVVTDAITAFTPDGLALKSGAELKADVIVSATGLRLMMLGGAQLRVDGAAVKLAERLIYKGMMIEGVPNLAFALGYTNASWTLKCELTSRYVCRLLAAMDRRGAQAATPSAAGLAIEPRPAITLTSGYVQRAADVLPRQGGRAPWRLNQNYVLDLIALRWGRVDDAALRFSRRQTAG